MRDNKMNLEVFKKNLSKNQTNLYELMIQQ